MPERHDLVVLGLGVGGVEVAGQCARNGMSVLAVEQRLVGGECPYWGCIPSKVMVRAAQVLAEAGRGRHRVAGLQTCTTPQQWSACALSTARAAGRVLAGDNSSDKTQVQRAHQILVGPREPAEGAVTEFEDAPSGRARLITVPSAASWSTK